ncbi:DMT family transporter [Streptomyces montanisoli]|uniref:DMT family transporter n=1 Tax=Streptomyces montanisoli TaxID=2798581 RepID=A0A940MME1_9ACTN|nr:DMT family transporter [Streptomyces montanisoli]MBP0461073.1 DMT family transporter [Streptomyces montanisoli]
MLCALGAAVCFGTAAVLQAVATRSTAPGSGSGVDAALFLRAARQWRYLLGLLLDAGGFALQIVALRSLPIYVVGAALAASLAVTAVVAARLLSVRLSRTEWTAVAVVCCGLAMLGLASGPEGNTAGSSTLRWAMLAVAAFVLLVGVVGGRLPGRARALVLGLGSGVGFGVVEVAVRLIDSLDLASGRFWTNPALYALLAAGGAAFLLLTSALQRGSVTTATAGMVVGETVGPALVGVIWLGDRTRPGLGWLAVLGFAVAVAGALLLARFGEAPDAAAAAADVAGNVTPGSAAGAVEAPGAPGAPGATG